MSKYPVQIADNAEQDLREIAQFIASEDSVEPAELLLDGTLGACDALETHSKRGRYMPELRAIGITAFRERIRKSFRITCEVSGRSVHVLIIADDRRALSTLLQKRLVR